MFLVKSQLPLTMQKEIDRIQAIDSAVRTTSETNFLAARAPYLTNTIIDEDENGLILRASGEDVPTDETGFKKGAFFIETDATGSGLYVNIGDETAAEWQTVDSTAIPAP